MFIATVVYEHADSPYMAFAWPGLIGWMVAAVWWFRNRDRFLPLAVQVVCAFEIVVGVVAARAYGVLEAEDMFISSGQWDPGNLTLHDGFVAEVVMLGVGCHVVLLLITGGMTAVTCSRRRKRASLTGEPEL